MRYIITIESVYTKTINLVQKAIITDLTVPFKLFAKNIQGYNYSLLRSPHVNKNAQEHFRFEKQRVQLLLANVNSPRNTLRLIVEKLESAHLVTGSIKFEKKAINFVSKF